MLPKGGSTIWGNASWSPEEGYDCSTKKVVDNSDGAVKEQTESGLELGAHGKPSAHYGRMVAFGKEAASVSVEVIRNRKKEGKVPLSPLFIQSHFCKLIFSTPMGENNQWFKNVESCGAQ